MRYLLVAVLVSCLPATGQAQGLVTFSTGFRGRAGPARDMVGAAPVFGLDVKPVRWRWGALGLELSYAPRMAQSDSGAYPNPGQGCYAPDGSITTCHSHRTVYGEAATQLGAVLQMGPRDRRFAPFGEIATGYYRAHPNGRHDIWDPNGVHLTNLSSPVYAQKDGVYARFGLGVRLKPWAGLPELSIGARYRWAHLGGPLTDYPTIRSGAEVVVGVTLR